MRVLWVTNIPFAYHNDMLGKKDVMITGGSWLYSAYEASKTNAYSELHIATSASVSECMHASSEGSNFYILPGGNLHSFDINSKENVLNCRWLIETSKPDVIILWGTESKLAYVVSKECGDVPIVVYIQGLINCIYKHYKEGIPLKYQYGTIRDIFDKLSPNSRINKYKIQSRLETEILSKSYGVIVENDWCEDQCKSINPRLKIYKNKLPIRSSVFNANWSLEKVERHSIFTNAGVYPIKGHHVLFKALGYVKQVVPDFKIYIPGPKYLQEYNHPLRRTGHIKMIEDSIKKYDLKKNVLFTGYLSEESLIQHIATCNVYVMPSIVENHSASLIEAMIVGAPCVSSLVGGVGNLVVNKENALLYNHLDAEALAGQIIRIFNDDKLAIFLSENCKKIKESRNSDFGAEMLDICKNVFTKD